ncbi:ABC transporter permease [Actinoplanes sp. TBRC 11911]|uniref:ABC transporter permease n=1 Tax=Actinoplanes sp. TBRC 11911 TaxID=2729386 RepID=UPI00145C694B|nr:ABC transporter permease [Actinoplanes sp. TBRC 11911]NMO54952.1 ABC transporter permease [Actinoplanes sp. TBRC 11911]
MTGTGKLIRLILRRDRFIMPLWVLVLGIVPAGYVSAFEGLFPTDQERIAYAQTSATNAGFVSLYGQLHGDSLGELVAWRSGFLPVIIGLFAALTVIRHTRTDEELGRTELIGAAAVGRQAQLAAALITTAAAGVVLGLVLFLGMIGSGLPAAGALAFGAEFTASAWIFAALAGIAAQLTSGARSARTLVVLAIGVSYVLRIVGDTSAIGDNGSLSFAAWLSPLGWVTHVFAFQANAWWPLALSALFSVVAVIVAVVLLGHRDLGSGMLPSRLGRPAAAAWLRTAPALAWRLHRGLLIGWTLGFALLGIVFGGVGSSVLAIAEDNKGLSDILGDLGGASSLADNYFAGTAGLVGLIASCYAVQATLRLRDEEQKGHAEAVLTTSVSRWTWAASHLLFSLIGPAVVLLAEGVAAGLTYDRARLGDILTGTMVQLPAVWVLAAIAVLLFGVVPRLSLVAWAPPAICLLVLLVGGTLRLDQWVLDISPFTHVPHVPGGSVTALPLVTLTAVALVLTFTGLGGLRRRNIPD